MMKKLLDKISFGTLAFIVVAVLLLLSVLIWYITKSSGPKCLMPDCSNPPASGSSFCSDHRIPPSYSGSYGSSNSSGKSYSSGASSSSSSSSSSSGKSAYRKSKSSAYDGYDSGYDDVFDDGEPDWDRYYKDDAYARGADDALEDFDDYGDDW